MLAPGVAFVPTPDANYCSVVTSAGKDLTESAEKSDAAAEQAHALASASCPCQGSASPLKRDGQRRIAAPAEENSDSHQARHGHHDSQDGPSPTECPVSLE